MHSLDLAVVALYFVFTLGVGLWVSRHQRSAADYFLGARDLPAWAILLSIVATETSRAHGHLHPRHRRPRRPDLPPAHRSAT